MCSTLDYKSSTLSTPECRQSIGTTRSAILANPYDTYATNVRRVPTKITVSDRSHIVPPPVQSSSTPVAPKLEDDIFSVTWFHPNTLLAMAFGPSLTMDPQLVRFDLPPSHRRVPTSMISSSAHGTISSTSLFKTGATAQGTPTRQ